MKPKEQEIKFNIPGPLFRMLSLRFKAEEAMFKLEAARNSQINIQEEKKEAKFNSYLKRLYFNYEPKFKYSKKDLLKDDLKDNIEEVGINQLNFEEKKELMTAIRNLQEALGHTKWEKYQHTERGIGGKNSMLDKMEGMTGNE